MDAGQLMQGALKLIGVFGPFLFGFLVLAYAGELIGLIKKAIGVAGKDRNYD